MAYGPDFADLFPARRHLRGQDSQRREGRRLSRLSVVPFITARQRIAELAIAQRLATVVQGRTFAEAGGPIGHYHISEETWRRATVYVDKILRGARPADLPVEQVTKLEPIINMKTAKVLGLTLPASLLLRADHVIE